MKFENYGKWDRNGSVAQDTVLSAVTCYSSSRGIFNSIMRSARVFYLLLSVLQFIFFLKLIELVRGEELSSDPQIFSQNVGTRNKTAQDDTGRGLFLAPRMKKRKLRQWNGTSTDATTGTIENSSFIKKTSENEKSQKTNSTIANKKDTASQESGRLCPGCENNCESAVANPIHSGFPIAPFVIAVIIGIKWFIIFLIIWIFFIRPDKHESGGYGGGGYGGGYGSPSPAYGSPSYDSDKDKDSFFGKIFDKIPFIHDHKHQRSLETYTDILNVVLDSVGKLTDLYNSS